MTGVAGPEPSDRSSVDTFGLPTPQRYWASLAIWMAVVMAVLDGTIANVALPTISAQLRVPEADAIWIVNAYQLATTMLLLPLAALGDRLGYRNVFIAGLVIFVMGSAGCAMSRSLAELIAARVVQGIGGSCLMSINAALQRFTYPSHLLGRGIAYNGMVVSVASAVGPTVASALLAIGPWPWLFAINIPIGLLALPLALKFLPRSPKSDHPFDLVSAFLNCLVFGGLILGAEGLIRAGVGAGAAPLVVGAVAAVLLVRRELPQAAPLVPIDLMRIPIFRLSIFTSATTFAAQMLALVALPFHLQGALARSAVETGVLMTPWPLAVAVTVPISGHLSDRVPAGMLGGVGLVVFGVGLALLAMVPADASSLDVCLRMVVCGVGFGLFQAPNNRTIIGSAPRGRSGAAGGMLSTARLLGQTTGAVLMALLFHLSLAQPTHAALWLGVCLAIGAAVISLMRLRTS